GEGHPLVNDDVERGVKQLRDRLPLLEEPGDESRLARRRVQDGGYGDRSGGGRSDGRHEVIPDDWHGCLRGEHLCPEDLGDGLAGRRDWQAAWPAASGIGREASDGSNLVTASRTAICAVRRAQDLGNQRAGSRRGLRGFPEVN